MKPNHLNALSLAIERGIVPLVDGTLFFNADCIPDLDRSDIPKLNCEQGFKPTYNSLQNWGANVAPILEDEKTAASAIINCGRVRKINEANITRAWNALVQGATLTVVGDKTTGVQPLRKWVAKRAEISESFSKFHALIFTFTKQVESWPEIELDLEAEGYHLSSGMFSANGPDKGSKLLAKHFDKRLRGKVADLGAGWGYLSNEVLQASERIESIDLYEADYLSLEAAKKNLTSKVPNEFHWIDINSEFQKKPYDWVLMNPPFHAGLGKGRANEPNIGKRFIEVASSTLIQGGRLLMVANRTLPYEEILKHTFRRTELLSDKNGYKVYESVK